MFLQHNISKAIYPIPFNQLLPTAKKAIQLIQTHLEQLSSQQKHDEHYCRQAAIGGEKAYQSYLIKHHTLRAVDFMSEFEMLARNALRSQDTSSDKTQKFFSFLQHAYPEEYTEKKRWISSSDLQKIKLISRKKNVLGSIQPKGSIPPKRAL